MSHLAENTRARAGCFDDRNIDTAAALKQVMHRMRGTDIDTELLQYELGHDKVFNGIRLWKSRRNPGVHYKYHVGFKMFELRITLVKVLVP